MPNSLKILQNFRWKILSNFLELNIFSGRKLLISIQKYSKVGAQYLKAFNEKQSKNILKDTIHDLKMRDRELIILLTKSS